MLWTLPIVVIDEKFEEDRETSNVTLTVSVNICGILQLFMHVGLEEALEVSVFCTIYSWLTLTVS